MVLIIRKSDNVITYAFDCSLNEVVIGADKTIAPHVIIMDMKSTTADKVEVATIPNDFDGGKYLYINNSFELNTEY